MPSELHRGWFHLKLAARVLDAGGVVAHATEGVWGLACDPFNPAAVAQVLSLKGRSADKGLIVIAAAAAEFAEELDLLLSEADRDRVTMTWPGATTWILPNNRFPAWITGASVGVAARVPGHAQARSLCETFAGPLVSTSANRSGHPPLLTALAVRREFGDEIDFLLPGGVGERTRASSIRRALDGERVRA